MTGFEDRGPGLHSKTDLLDFTSVLDFAAMNIFTVLFGVPLSIAFAFLGRWLLLHPERLAPEGQFMGPYTFGARLFRFQVTAVGTFALFFGALGSIFAALHWVAVFSPALLGAPGYRRNLWWYLRRHLCPQGAEISTGVRLKQPSWLVALKL